MINTSVIGLGEIIVIQPVIKLLIFVLVSIRSNTQGVILTPRFLQCMAGGHAFYTGTFPKVGDRLPSAFY